MDAARAGAEGRVRFTEDDLFGFESVAAVHSNLYLVGDSRNSLSDTPDLDIEEATSLVASLREGSGTIDDDGFPPGDARNMICGVAGVDVRETLNRVLEVVYPGDLEADVVVV